MSTQPDPFDAWLQACKDFCDIVMSITATPRFEVRDHIEKVHAYLHCPMELSWIFRDQRERKSDHSFVVVREPAPALPAMAPPDVIQSLHTIVLSKPLESRRRLADMIIRLQRYLGDSSPILTHRKLGVRQQLVLSEYSYEVDVKPQNRNILAPIPGTGIKHGNRPAHPHMKIVGQLDAKYKMTFLDLLKKLGVNPLSKKAKYFDDRMTYEHGFEITVPGLGFCSIEFSN